MDNIEPFDMEPIKMEPAAKHDSIFVKIPTKSIHYFTPQKEKILREAEKKDQVNIVALQALVQKLIDVNEPEFTINL